MKKIILFFFIFSTVFIFSQDLIVSIGALPIFSNSKDSGILISFINEMDKNYDEGNIIIKDIFPFARSIRNSIKYDNINFHIPMIRSPQVDKDKLPYLESTAKFRTSCFVIYTKNENINMFNIENYKSATLLGHTHVFPFEILGVPSVESGIKMVENGRIDAWIFAQDTTDYVIKSLGYNKILKEKYRDFDVIFVLPKSEVGENTDKILTEIIDKMEKNKSLYFFWGDLYNEKLRK